MAPPTYYENVAKRRDVDRLSIRARSDISLKIEIRGVFEQTFRVYGFREIQFPSYTHNGRLISRVRWT